MEWFQKVWENNIADVSKCEKHFLQEDFPEKAPLFLGIAQITPPPMTQFGQLFHFCFRPILPSTKKVSKINMGTGSPPKLVNAQKKVFFWEVFPFSEYLGPNIKAFAIIVVCLDLVFEGICFFV